MTIFHDFYHAFLFLMARAYRFFNGRVNSLANKIQEILYKFPMVIKGLQFDRCQCCGGMITITIKDNYLYYFCNPSDKDVHCEHYGDEKFCKELCYGLKDGKMNNEKMIKYRVDLVKMIYFIIMKRIEKYGYCVVNNGFDTVDAVILSQLRDDTTVLFTPMKFDIMNEKIKHYTHIDNVNNSDPCTFIIFNREKIKHFKKFNFPIMLIGKMVCTDEENKERLKNGMGGSLLLDSIKHFKIKELPLKKLFIIPKLRFMKNF